MFIGRKSAEESCEKVPPTHSLNRLQLIRDSKTPPAVVMSSSIVSQEPISFCPMKSDTMSSIEVDVNTRRQPGNFRDSLGIEEEFEILPTTSR